MAKSKDALPRGPDGQVLYAIGDVHGRLDLLADLIDLIHIDMAASPDIQPTVILLGDYIDRGSNSPGVLESVLRYQAGAPYKVITLRGNHEQFLLTFLAQDGQVSGHAWLNHGGRNTLASYGVQPPADHLDIDGWTRTARALAAAMPASHHAFLERTQLMAVLGDYVFVHAGVRPDVPLAEQHPDDLMNIRKPFLKAKRPYKDGAVVFGHTIFETPLVETWKIGIDTGAYATGRLTALRLEGDQRRLITTEPGRGRPR